MVEPIPYVEHAPDPALRHLVACYWTIRMPSAPAVPGHAVILPDGCLDFIFDLDAERATLVGAMTRPLFVPTVGPRDLIGVRFRPGAMPMFVDVPADEVTDDVVALGDALGGGADALRDAMQAADGTAARIRLLNTALVARVRATRRGDPLALAVAAHLERHVHRPRIRVEGLADRLGLSRRQLERRFRAAVGIPASTARRILRFQTVVTRMHAEPDRPLSWLAQDAGYHDQAHMTRDFRLYAGQPPGAYRTERVPAG